VLAIGNLCANPANLEEIVAAGCVPTLATYAYPSRDSSVNVQFQAAAGLRGLASHDTLRVELLHQNILEPLMLAATAPATGEHKPGVVYDELDATVDPEVQREVAAALCNLALAEENKVSVCVLYAVCWVFANLYACMFVFFTPGIDGECKCGTRFNKFNAVQ
jgi:hypothetical protein